MARTAAKLCENAFQTIPDVSFFDAEKKKVDDLFGSEILFFANLASFLGSHAQTDLKINFLVKFCSR